MKFIDPHGERPTIPRGFELYYHRRPKSCGQETPDGAGLRTKVKLFSYGRQKHADWETGHYIFKKVKNPMSVSILDDFLQHPENIPTAWEGMLVCFWGTIYSRKETLPVMGMSGDLPPVSYERLYVRCLFKSGGTWRDDMIPLDDQFGPSRVSVEMWRPGWFKRLTAKLGI